MGCLNEQTAAALAKVPKGCSQRSSLDDLIELVEQHSAKEYRNMERTLILSLKLLCKVFLQSLQDLSQLTSFSKIWSGILSSMERYMKVKFRGKRSEKIQELVPELLKNILLVMKSSGILVPLPSGDGNSFWELTWSNVKNIAPSLQLEVFPSDEVEQQLQKTQTKDYSSIQDGSVSVPPGETTAA